MNRLFLSDQSWPKMHNYAFQRHGATLNQIWRQIIKVRRIIQFGQFRQVKDGRLSTWFSLYLSQKERNFTYMNPFHTKILLHTCVFEIQLLKALDVEVTSKEKFYFELSFIISEPNERFAPAATAYSWEKTTFS